MEAAPRVTSVARSSRKRSAQPNEAGSSRAGERQLEVDESVEFLGERPTQKRKKQHKSNHNAIPSSSALRKQPQQSGTSSSVILLPETPPSAARAQAAAAEPSASAQTPSLSPVQSFSGSDAARKSRKRHRTRSKSGDGPAPVDKGKKRSIDMSLIEEAGLNEKTIVADGPGDTVASLKAELEGMREQLATKDAFIDSSRACVEHIYNLATCTICLELAWRPHVLPCGHVFCAGCLIGWFEKRSPDEAEPPAFLQGAELAEFQRRSTLSRPKVCPSCRASVTSRPVEVWMIKGMLEKLEDAHRAGHGEGGEHAGNRNPEEIRQHRQEGLAQGATLWKDIFTERGDRPRIIHDIEDNVDRCGDCAMEVVDGECVGCGLVYNNFSHDEEDFSDDGDAGVEIVDHIRNQMRLNALAAAGNHFIGDSDDDGSFSGDEDEGENRYLDTDDEDGHFSEMDEHHHHYGFASDDEDEEEQLSGSDVEPVVVRRNVRAPVIRIDDSDDDEVVFGRVVRQLSDDEEEEADEDLLLAHEGEENSNLSSDDDDAERAEAHLGEDLDDEDEHSDGGNSDSSAEPDIHERRMLAFDAAQRRLQRAAEKENSDDSSGEAEENL